MCCLSMVQPAAADETDQTDMEDDAGDSKEAASLPQATDDVVEVLDTALKNFTPRRVIKLWV